METSVSLLNRAKGNPKSEAWTRILEIYEPLIGGWLRKNGISESDVLDITQDVLYALSTGLTDFEHNGRRGAFRNWLRLITVNRARRHWTQKKKNVSGSGISEELLDKLEDPNSDLSKQWDEEHDRHVLTRILQMIAPDFDPVVMTVFQKVAVEGLSPSDVANNEGISTGLVYKYKYRVMQRMMAEAKGILDDEFPNPSSEN